ncbi:MAG: hypothetical protein WBM00_10800 [Solirubrobacterales bacterium]
MPTDPFGRSIFEHIRDDGELVRSAPPGQYICDFCTTVDPVWMFPCGEVRVVGNVLFNASDDEWLTCERCHDLIEAGDLAGLAEYAATIQCNQSVAPGWEPRPHAQMSAFIRANAEAFMAARKGAPRRIDPKTAEPL